MPMPGRIAQILANQQAAAAQGSLTIPEILDSGEMAFMQRVWPEVRSAAQFSHINWSAHGLPGGPELSPVSYAAIAHVWPQIRVAADFSHPNWSGHPVPINVLQAAMPLPELPSAPQPVTPAAPPPTQVQPAPPISVAPVPVPTLPLPQGPTFVPAPPVSISPSVLAPPVIDTSPPQYVPPAVWGSGVDDPTQPVSATTPAKAGIFGGLLSMPMILTAAGLLLFFSLARGARQTPVRRRRRR